MIIFTPKYLEYYRIPIQVVVNQLVDSQLMSQLMSFRLSLETITPMNHVYVLQSYNGHATYYSPIGVVTHI